MEVTEGMVGDKLHEMLRRNWIEVNILNECTRGISVPLYEKGSQ